MLDAPINCNVNKMDRRSVGMTEATITWSDKNRCSNNSRKKNKLKTDFNRIRKLH